jgi:hypothetical protein
LFVQQADKHTCKETTKNNEGKQHRNKTQMETFRVWPRGRKEKKIEAESFKHMKIKYPTHLKMAM